MDAKYLIEICKSLYEQKHDETESFINSIADFLLANKDNSAVISEEFKPLIVPMYNIWTTNALSELLEGRLFISEAFLNNLASIIIGKSTTVKSIDVNCYGNGSMDCMIEHRMGRFLIKGEVVECVHNSHKSNLVVSINDKKTLNVGLSKLFSSLAMSMANGLLVKNLNKNYRNGIKMVYASDIVTVDFKDFIKTTFMNRYEFMGKKLSDLVSVTQAVVIDGGIELRLKYNVNE